MLLTGTRNLKPVKQFLGPAPARLEILEVLYSALTELETSSAEQAVSCKPCEFRSREIQFTLILFRKLPSNPHFSLLRDCLMNLHERARRVRSAGWWK